MFEMEKFEEYFRTTERYQDFLCWGSDKWIFKSVDGRYLSEEIQRLYEVWQHQQAKAEELQKRVDKAIEAINEHYDSDGMSGLYFMDLKEILEEEQALKGEGND